MTDSERQAISDVLPSFTLRPLPDGWTPLQAFVLIKAFDEDGRAAWSYRTSEQLNMEELLGALTLQIALIKRRLLEEWDEG